MKKKFLCFGNNVNRQTKQLIFSRLIQNLQNFFLEKKNKTDDKSEIDEGSSVSRSFVKLDFP